MAEAQNEVVKFRTTSSRSAEGQPIVLRETTTTRLVFRPVLVSNSKDPSAAIDGCFVFERKTRLGHWHEVNDLPLSKLKAEEWVKIDLKAAELLTLFQSLDTLYQVVGEHGLGRGTSEYIRAPESQALRTLIADESKFKLALGDQELMTSLLGGLASWITANERAVAAARFDGISLEDLQQFDAVLGLARLQRFRRELDEHRDSNESVWQAILESNGWVIAQVYAIPVMLVQGQVYVGGKRLTNRGGNTVDFLFQNQISGNVVLVEIKNPGTELLGKVYRNNVFPPSEELSGGLIQTLNSRASLIENFSALTPAESDVTSILSPRALLIVGTLDQLGTDLERKSFELFRTSQRDIDIVTFDELGEKVQLMIELLQNVVE